MMASTKRDSTRAVSAMVSPRPSCISAPVSMIVSPPSSRMPTSKDTRVRVDGLLEDHRQRPAGERPFGRGRPLRPARLDRGGTDRGCRAASARGIARDRGNAGGRYSVAVMSRKRAVIRRMRLAVRLRRAARSWRAGCLEPRRTPSSISSSRDDQRRQQPHDIVAGRDHEHVARRGRRRRNRPAARAAEAEHQPFAAHFGDDVGMAVLRAPASLCLQQQALARDRRRESRRRAPRRARRCRPAMASGLPP